MASPEWFLASAGRIVQVRSLGRRTVQQTDAGASPTGKHFRPLRQGRGGLRHSLRAWGALTIVDKSFSIEDFRLLCYRRCDPEANAL